MFGLTQTSGGHSAAGRVSNRTSSRAPLRKGLVVARKKFKFLSTEAELKVGNVGVSINTFTTCMSIYY